jgi:hypothetical protein
MASSCSTVKRVRDGATLECFAGLQADDQLAAGAIGCVRC